MNYQTKKLLLDPTLIDRCECVNCEWVFVKVKSIKQHIKPRLYRVKGKTPHYKLV
jgi:hypothetical protein